MTPTRFHGPAVTVGGAAVAGRTDGPKPAKASVASNRIPSTSACGTRTTPARAASTSRSSRNAVPARFEQQRVLGHLGDRHRSRLVERMAFGHDEHELLVEQRLRVDVGRGERQVDDRQVEAAVEQLGEERGGGGVDHDHLDARVGGGDRREEQRHEPATGGADHAQAHVAGDVVRGRGDVGRPARRARTGCAGPGRPRARRPRSAGRCCGRPGWPRARARGGRCGWTRSTAPCAAPGRGREAAVVGHGGQGGQLAEVHRSS